MGAVGGCFTVEVSKKEVVAAALPMQEHWLPLSNLDLVVQPIDVGVFFCYNTKDSNITYDSMVSVLKAALARALVPYYPFAGEVVKNPEGEPELLCNNRGVEFTEASANIELYELNLYNPDESVEGKLVPKKGLGILAVQVTRLKCGGLVVACTFNHQIADAYSTNMFLVSWAEMANTCKTSLSMLPSYRRSLLNPRRPIHFNSSFEQIYIPASALLPTEQQSEPTLTTDYYMSRIYHVKANQICELQRLASENGRTRTKFESFSAFLWKMVCKHAYSHENCGLTSKIGIVVDGRTRFGDKKSLMKNYFGNVLSLPFGENKVSEIAKMPLSWVANEIHWFLKNAATEDHFLGMIDWIEARRPSPCYAKIYCSGSLDGPAFVVSSGQQFPVSSVDFGWGKPVFGSYHFPWGGKAGYAMPMPSPAQNGDWIVYLNLLQGQLKFIETEASNVFMPFTWTNLN